MTFNTWFNMEDSHRLTRESFKPYYKWMTFNTDRKFRREDILIRFKPYYKWMTFNTVSMLILKELLLI